jgi:hypothetical protein
MNTTVGMDLAIRTDNVVLKLKEALNDKATDASTKTTIAQLLSVIALMPDGHTYVPLGFECAPHANLNNDFF